jgi:predicted metal-binding membrane protein
VNGPTALASTPRIGPLHGTDLGVAGRFPAVTLAIGGAWAALVVAQLSGEAAALHHHALIEGGVPPALTIVSFTFAWQVMVVAMMWPASLHAVFAVGLASPDTSRPRTAIAAFLGSFAIVWGGFGLAAFLGDMVLHRVVDATPWLAARPWLIEAGVLAMAGAYQLTPLKRRAMAACREPGQRMAMHDEAEPRAGRLGISHALDCVASSWALMLVMFGAGFASVPSMAALTLLMGYEVTGRHGRRAATIAGTLLLFGALWVVAGPMPG